MDYSDVGTEKITSDSYMAVPMEHSSRELTDGRQWKENKRKREEKKNKSTNNEKVIKRW